MKIIHNNDSVIIVLHEIYGINQHIQQVCEKYSKKGYDVLCPNLINRVKPYQYDQEQEAYQHFMQDIGFESTIKQVKQEIATAKEQYKKVFLLGYSIGASVAWICSDSENMINGVIGYYGSRIRDYKDIVPKSPVLLIFPIEESSFSVEELIHSLERPNIEVHMLNGRHGFCDPYSKNYCAKASQEAEDIVDDFFKKLSSDFIR